MASDFNLIEAQRAVLHMSTLSSSAKLVAFAVYSFWSTKSPKPYPGTAMLQRLTGLSKPTVIRAIKELVVAKVVAVDTDQNVHGQRFVFDLEPVMILDRSKNNTGQVEGPKPVKKRSQTGKGEFTNQHQNGSRSTEEIQEEIQGRDPDLVKGSTPTKTPPSLADQCRKVFDFWKSEHNHPNAKIDAKRTAKIKAALKIGFTVNQLCRAIRGAKQDGFLMGTDPKSNGKVFDSIATLLREADQIERLICLHESSKAQPSGQPTKLQQELKAVEEREIAEMTAKAQAQFGKTPGVANVGNVARLVEGIG